MKKQREIELIIDGENFGIYRLQDDKKQTKQAFVLSLFNEIMLALHKSLKIRVIIETAG